MLASQSIFIFIFLLIAGIGVLVLFKNPANVINKRFCIFAQVIDKNQKKHIGHFRSLKKQYLESK